MLAALVAAALLYVLFRRSSPAQSHLQSFAPQIAGAPVPDYNTALALQQNSLLNSIASLFSGGGGSTSSTPVTAGSVSTTDMSGPGNVATPTPTRTPRQRPSTPFNENANAASFAAAAAAAGVPGPLNLHASGGFNSDAYKQLQWLEFLGNLGSSGGDGGGGGGGGGVGAAAGGDAGAAAGGGAAGTYDPEEEYFG